MVKHRAGHIGPYRRNEQTSRIEPDIKGNGKSVKCLMIEQAAGQSDP